MGFCWSVFSCIFAAVAYGLGLWLYPASPVTYFLGILIGCGLASLIHELGHLAAYRLLKLSWRRLEFACFVFRRGEGVRIDTRKRFFAASCTCAYDPSVPYWRYQIALLSGSGVCFLLCAASFIACCYVSGTLRAFLLCLGIASGLNWLSNLLPLSADRRLLKQIKQERENLA